MEYHRYADLFPMMSDDEFKALVEDMRSGGYDERFPIVTFENKILDGRNRYKASIEAKVNPKYEEFIGDNALDFVIRSNLKRRHLNETQRAVVASRIANMPGHRPNKSANLRTSQSEAAQMVNVSPRTLQTVKSIERDAPELIEKMERGEMTAHEAEKIVKESKRQEQRKKAEKAGNKIKSSSELWKVIHGDIKKVGVQVPDNSIDLILTDPPYPEEFLYCWDALSELADRVLKPSGFVFAYSGQLHLPEAMTRLSTHLKYYWTMSLEHAGNNQLIMPRNVFCGWKPILIYQKSPFKRFEDKFSDFIRGSGREKGLHDWQQGEDELDYIINTFTLHGQTILDPFCGSGTTLVASVKNKRYAIGIDIEEENYLISKRRLSDVKEV